MQNSGRMLRRLRRLSKGDWSSDGSDYSVTREEAWREGRRRHCTKTSEDGTTPCSKMRSSRCLRVLPAPYARFPEDIFLIPSNILPREKDIMKKEPRLSIAGGGDLTSPYQKEHPQDVQTCSLQFGSTGQESIKKHSQQKTYICRFIYVHIPISISVCFLLLYIRMHCYKYYRLYVIRS